jgi:hypothetical protein
MLTRIAITSTVLAALAAAAPQPQVAGYTNADASFSVTEPTGTIATVFGPDSQVLVSNTVSGSNISMLTITRLNLLFLDQLLLAGVQT